MSIRPAISSTFRNAGNFLADGGLGLAFLRATVDVCKNLRRHCSGVLLVRSATRDANEGRSELPNSCRISLVGAGPGNVDLLTLKAARAIQAAEIILHDALVCADVLALARPDARLIAVGKRGGRTSCRQDDINQLMVTLARSNNRIVRLKAGDPSIFGRAGEEIEFLREAGIKVDIIPGVTAASAMAAAFGLSLTHRNHAKSVRFVSGHSKSGGLPEDLDWRAIADPSATTIFYMGRNTASEISTRLIGFGLPVETCVGLGAAISRPDQRLAFCTLRSLPAAARQLDPLAPILIGVGAVFSRLSARDEEEWADFTTCADLRT